MTSRSEPVAGYRSGASDDPRVRKARLDRASPFCLLEPSALSRSRIPILKPPEPESDEDDLPSSSSGPIGIQSVEIAWKVLDALLDRTSPVTLAALGRDLRMQPSKLHRYLVSLTRCGLVWQSPLTGRYELGPSSRRVGVAALERYDGLSAAHDCVSELSANTGFTTLLYIWTELGATLIRSEDGAHPLPLTLRVGSTVPLCRSGAGRVFLSYLPEGITRSILEAELAKARGDRLSGPELKQIVADVRKARAYWTPVTILPGAKVLAAPLFGLAKKLLCVIAMAVPDHLDTPPLRTELSASLLREVDASAGITKRVGVAEG